MPKPPPYSEIINGYGARLRAARCATSKSAKALASELNVTPQRWSHWEVERHPPDLVTMMAYKLRYGVTLDWVFAADPSGLPLHIAQSIVSQASHPDADPQMQALVHLFGRSNISRTGLGGLNEDRGKFG